MEIILKDDVKGLGYKNDIVTVKPGYARNYLIPQGFAITATASNKKVLEENLKQAAHKAQKIKQDALDLSAAMFDIVLEIPAKVSETGKIFGAVTNIQIAEALNKALLDRGLDKEIDRRKISFAQKEVKELGKYVAVIDLHKEVKPEVEFKVVEA